MSEPQELPKRSQLHYTTTAVVTGTPEPYRSMTDHQLLETIAVDSERAALSLASLVQLAEQSLSPRRSQVLDPEQSTETPVSNPPAEPTTPKQPESDLTEIRALYYTFRDYVLNGQVKISSEDSEVMNRLDQAFENKEEFAPPKQLESVQGDSEKEVLANGTEVPRYLIEVLNDFEKIWPGASLYSARPALVGQIITAQNAKKTTIYPFCMNDDANIPEKGSPCILKKGHRGRHKDNDDGSWA